MEGIKLNFKHYALTGLSVSSAFLLTLLLQPVLTSTIFPLFVIAVAISTCYGSIITGLIATILSTLAANYFFLQSVHSPLAFGLTNTFSFGAFVLVTILISSLNSDLNHVKQNLKTCEAECQRTQETLRISEKKLEYLLKSNIVGIAYGNLNGSIRYANEYFLKMIGYSHEELVLGKIRWDTITPSEYLELDAQALEKIKKYGIGNPFHQEYIGKDGNRVPIVINFGLLQENQNSQLEKIVFCLNLSEIKKIKHTLCQREDELRLITNSVPGLISYIDSQQCYRFNNKKYQEWYGLSTTEIYGKHIQEVWGERIYKLIHPYIKTVLSGKQVSYEAEIPSLDGNTRYVHVSYVPHFNAGGVVEGFVALINEMTEQKLAVQEREKLLASEKAARTEAEAANRMKDEFLATLSHELRTPLNAMIGWAQLLRNRKFDEATTAKALETIERNSKSLAMLVEDVLDVSRIIRGTLQLNLNPVELISVLKAALDIVRPASVAKEIHIECKFDSGVGMVIGDANRLQQVMCNLLTNAVKFTPPKGRIEVQVERVNDIVQICVSDTGEGIAPEFLPYVFDRFRQADSSNTRSHGGIGLGLAIVRHLVELHGGRVFAYSSGMGQGSTFSVHLPMKAVDIEKTKQLSSSMAEEGDGNSLLSLAGLRVLIVDDETDTRDLLMAILGEYQAEAIAVASVHEALDLLSQFQPDVLVSDISMPSEDGYSLIRKVRSRPQSKSTPAVALTAHATSEDRTKVLLAGFQIHVPKPVDPTELVVVVANLARRAQKN